ncbi:MAG: hypothetical protein SO020_07045, partial [Lachnospiraceae bacterium]|nr:hypothetical protein [Lachnospiraceae bacterium]
IKRKLERIYYRKFHFISVFSSPPSAADNDKFPHRLPLPHHFAIHGKKSRLFPNLLENKRLRPQQILHFHTIRTGSAFFLFLLYNKISKF